MKLNRILIVIFLIISVVSVLVSGAPAKVHAVNLSSFAIAFLLPGLIAQRHKGIGALFILLIGAIVGLVLWDIGTSYVVVKRELFMGWYLLYPVGVLGLLALQHITKQVHKKLPYNKALSSDALKRAG